METIKADSISALSRDELRNVCTSRIRRIRIVGDPWSDDHILCATAEFVAGGKRYRVGLWWIGWEGVAALQYAAESSKARLLAISIIKGLAVDELGE